jgi:hypothetical protein
VEHECARYLIPTQDGPVLFEPGLVEIQLQVVSEYVDALVRFVSVHKWDRETADMAEKYCDSIHAKLREVIRGSA